MTDGDWKVTLNGVDYENEWFTDIQVTGRENGVSSAALLGSNKDAQLWFDVADVFDTVKIYVEDAGSYVEIFDGTVREPTQIISSAGMLAGFKCKGLGAALEDTHCKDMFGYTSNQPTLDTVEEILEDLVDNSVNKSYSSANNTGYAITKTYIPTIDAGLSIPFFNAPYQTCKSVVDLVCQLDTAYRDGSTAGPHYFVDVSGNLRVKTIGTQQVDGGGGGGDWGVYYKGAAASAAANCLYEGVDFVDYSLSKPTDSYANNVVLAFDLRKPPYDWWSDLNPQPGGTGGSQLWGNDALTSITDDNAVGHFVVGLNSLNFDPNGAVQGYGYYPAAANANWDTEKWGSEVSVPTVNFYCLKHNLTVATTYIYLSTNDVARKTSFFYATFFTFGLLGWPSEPDDTWIHKTIPIGPYWRTIQESRAYRWTNSDGNADWANIDTIEFSIAGGGEGGYLLIDDLHFSGKCIREAVDTSEVTSYNEYQQAILSRTPFDDTAVAADDSGMAGQLAHAELLRRVRLPQTLRCTVGLKPYLNPGEHWKVYAGKYGSSYKVNGVDFRTLEYTHRIGVGGKSTTLLLTDDVLNSFPMSRIDARQVLNEYLLENNAKATDMQGGEVDLLIPHLRKTY